MSEEEEDEEEELKSKLELEVLRALAVQMMTLFSHLLSWGTFWLN
jgi:hypothetical protein